MDVLHSFRATAHELVELARQHGTDLESLRTDFTFLNGRRWIDVWRKDAFPGTGPIGEPHGTLHYNLQGKITSLPTVLKESADVFRGSWSEAGTFENLEQALELVKAWLIETKEVDDLPARRIRRYGF